MSRWVYWVSIIAIVVVLGFPAVRVLPPYILGSHFTWVTENVPVAGYLLSHLSDPQADISDLFRLGIDLEGGTMMSYELRAADPSGQAPNAQEAKKVISGRIDPQGTRGYIVRAAGPHRLEIVLPGRATKVHMSAEAVAQDTLAGAQQRATAQQNAAVVSLLQDKSAAFLAGTVLHARLSPPLYLEDIQTRISEALRERLPAYTRSVATVGDEKSGDQWQAISVFIPIAATDSKAVGEWEKVVSDALSAQRDVTRVKRLVRQAGFLEFRIVAEKVKDREKANFEHIVQLKEAGQPPDSPQWRWYPMKRAWEWYNSPSPRGGNLLDERGFVYVVDKDNKTVEVLVNVGDGQDVNGRDLSRAISTMQSGEPIVQFDMKPTAAARFARLTNPDMRDRYMAIILDGVIQSSPTLRATLSTGGIIEGYKDQHELDEVVTVLNSGSLAASLGDPVSEVTMGPELGEDNIHNGLTASLIGFGLVIVFMAVYYLFAGVVADLAVILNLVLTVCLMYCIRQTWTLPGIAGLILALAMAVDANVLIFERLREEKGKEGSLSFALKRAYARAFTTIFDSNLTTVIPAFVLLLPGLATEEVKGFAIVIIIGIGVSMFTAIVVTRMIFETGIRWGLIKQMKMLHLFEKPSIDWMKFARFAFVTTLILSVSGVLLFAARGQDKYDIEFVGGTRVTLALKPPAHQEAVPIELVRRRATEVLGPATTVQEVSEVGATGLSRFAVTVPAVGGKISGEAAVKEALSKAFEDMRPEGTTQAVDAKAVELTEEIVRQRQDASKPTAPAAAPEAPAPSPATPTTRFIPPELRQYIGQIRVMATVDPPMALEEVQRRIDTLIRDRYPDLVGTLYTVQGAEPAPTPGDFKSFDLWVRDAFTGKHADTPSPTFWSDLVTMALGRQEAFASTTSFEPTMAREAWDKAVIAILFSLVAMAVYIWLRFAKFSSGIAAVVATVHDVLITLGAVTAGGLLYGIWTNNWFALTDMKINLPMIGAFLTLVGYSVNDTIVVFDRIRENRGKYGDLSVSIINNSINQTLSRTVLTSSTVFLAVVALYFFGGKDSSIHGLAFVMLIGTVVGCYSSIAIASPILVMYDYLKRVYAWAYPIVGVLLLAYFVAVWHVSATGLDSMLGADGSFAALFQAPDGKEVFTASLLHYALTAPSWILGSWLTWTFLTLALLWVVWLALVTWGLACKAYGRPWPLQTSAPVLVKVLAAVSLLAPLATVILFAVAVLSSASSGWAAPAAFAAFMTCPATYTLYRQAWGKAEQKN